MKKIIPNFLKYYFYLLSYHNFTISKIIVQTRGDVREAPTLHCSCLAAEQLHKITNEKHSNAAGTGGHIPSLLGTLRWSASLVRSFIELQKRFKIKKELRNDMPCFNKQNVIKKLLILFL